MLSFLRAVLLLIAAAPQAQLPQPQTALVHTADVDLATFTYGIPSTATPIIAVNGGPGLSHMYMIQNDVWTRRIAEHRQVIFYDQRGTGASRRLRPNAEQTMTAQVADLEAIRASLHADKVDFIGDSYGGLLASAYAVAHPEHVHTLILSDSAAPGLPRIHPRLEEVFPDIIAQTKEQVEKLHGQDDADAKAAELDLRAHFRMIFYSRELCDRYLANAPDLGFDPATSDAVSKAIANLDLTAQMARFHFPTLVIQGRFDLNVTPDVSWTVAHTIPGAQLVWFEKSGHLPYYEEPHKYVTVVNQFLLDHDVTHD
jgi:proline iminopeptidase